MATKARKAEDTNAADKVQRYIYLGPNHPQALIVNATIYKGGIPANIQELLEKCPSAKALLVPIKNTAQVMRDLRQKDTANAILYKNAQQELHKI